MKNLFLLKEIIIDFIPNIGQIPPATSVQGVGREFSCSGVGIRSKKVRPTLQEKPDLT